MGIIQDNSTPDFQWGTREEIFATQHSRDPTGTYIFTLQFKEENQINHDTVLRLALLSFNRMENLKDYLDRGLLHPSPWFSDIR